MKCQPGCLCARHDWTPFTGNPNWAEDFEERRLQRYLKELARRTADERRKAEGTLP